MSVTSADRDGVKFSAPDSPSSGVLHISTVRDRFDETRDVALGPHCFLENPSAYPGWRDLAFVAACENEKAIEVAEARLRVLIRHLLPGVSDRLNALHGTSYSVDFWHLIVTPWLVEVAQRAWCGYVKMEKIIQRLGDAEMTVPVYQGEPGWTFDDTSEFFNVLLHDDDFNWWIDSEIVAALAPSNWKLRKSDRPDAPAKPMPKNPQDRQVSAPRRALRNLKYLLGYTDIVGIRWAGLLLAVYANLLPKRPSRLRFRHAEGFDPTAQFPPPFLAVLDRLLDTTMPRSFTDGFPELARKARRIPTWPGRLRLGALSFWNEQEKVIAAFAQEAGEKRVGCQHGGEYSILNYNVMFNAMESECSVFFTWGWTNDDPVAAHLVPLPSPYLGRIADRHKRQNDSIILVGQPIRIHLNRLHWWTQGDTQLRYCDETVRLLDGLGEDALGDVVFRPYVRAKSEIEIADIVRRHFPDIPMMLGDLHGEMLKCKLTVISTYSTNLNIVMAANIPAVVVLSRSVVAPRPEAEPYFQALRECGVIHETPEAAARHINRINGDVDSWWRGADVQLARKQWAHEFARTDRFWWWQWMKALAGLRDVG